VSTGTEIQAAYLHSGHFAGLAGNRSPGGGVAAAFAIAACVVAFAIIVLLAVTSARRTTTDWQDGDLGPEDGGGGPSGDPPSGPRPSGEDPLWWPEFEREFADYVTSDIRR
jgi:hypothetical protein